MRDSSYICFAFDAKNSKFLKYNRQFPSQVFVKELQDHKPPQAAERWWALKGEVKRHSAAPIEFDRYQAQNLNTKNWKTPSSLKNVTFGLLVVEFG